MDRQPELFGELETTIRTSAVSVETAERIVGEILREASGLEWSDIDQDATFLELGFDSLFLIQFSGAIRSACGVKLSIRELLETIATPAALVAHLPTQPDWTAGAVAPTPEIQVAVPPEAPAPRPPSPSVVVEPRTFGSTPRIAPSPPREGVSISGIEAVLLEQQRILERQLDVLAGLDSSGPAQPLSAPTNSVSTASVVQPVSPLRPSPPERNGALVEATTATRFGPYKPVRRAADRGLTERQQTHLNGFIERFTQRTAKSKEHAERYRDEFADPRGVAGYRRIWKGMVYQIGVVRSKGSKLWDLDGNEYVDIAMGFGLNLFGQSPDFVTDALRRQLELGVEVGPQSPLAGEVARLLCGFSRKDRVTFCNTGSEAVMTALRLARTVSQRSKVVYFNKDYHGNFDEVLVRSHRVGGVRRASPAAPGVPPSVTDNLIVLDYGSEESLAAIEAQADEIAAVLVEPVQSADPFNQPRQFLRDLRALTRERDIALVMDEVISGFRVAQGGAQEWLDVWGDMATYGKILGGGLPIGALAGSARYMDALDGGTWRYDDQSEPDADMTFFAGTFVRHPLAIAAAHQVLTKIKEEGPQLQERLTEKTTHLVTTLNRFFEEELIPIRLAQFASQFRFAFPPDLDYVDLLYFHLLDRGIFTRGWADNCFLSTAHSDQDIARVIDAVKDSCREIRSGGFLPERDDDDSGTRPKEPSENGLLSLVPPAAPGGSVSANRFRCIDEIQPEGDKTPVFCMPAADGLTVVYHQLSECLGADQPIYGLNSPGVAGEELPQTLEALATRFVEEIRDVQPKGPYLLAGYCSGGTLALEAAQQLKEAGEQVAMLALIETYNWLDAPSTNPTLWVSGVYQLQRLYFHLRNFLLLSARNKGTFLRAKLATLRDRTKIWRRKFFGGTEPGRGTVLRPVVDMAELWRAHDLLSEAYEPRPYPGKLLLFRPRRDYRCHRSTEFEATEGLVIKRMKAFPAGMMADPFAGDLARELEEAIQNGMRAATTKGETTGSG